LWVARIQRRLRSLGFDFDFLRRQVPPQQVTGKRQNAAKQEGHTPQLRSNCRMRHRQGRRTSR
jgi:hypothetical protein